MASEYIFLKGKTKWFRPTAPDSRYGEPKWKHVLYLDDDSLNKFRELQKKGLKNKLNKDDDGYYCTLSRKTQKTWQGKVTGQQPPLIMDADGKTPLHDVNVGNGSDVTTKVRLYWWTDKSNGSKKPAIEWDSTRVDHLVPFTKSRGDFTEAEEEQSEGFF